MIRAVLLDLAGVVYQGEVPLPGAVDAVAGLRQAGLRLRFLTNTTRMPRRALHSRLNDMGIRLVDEELFTPAQAARAWLAARKLSPYLLIHPALAEDFAGLSGSEGEAVVVGDAAHGFTYAALNEAFRKLLAGAEFLALARNRSFKDEDGELSLDAGAFVAALEYATQREAVLLGKPAPDFFKAALASTACEVKEAVMVGDDAEADIAGALLAGIRSALLVRTGKYRPGDERRADPPPSGVVEDLAAAARWILERRF
ncbi:TIGR01458 family HAD-type hydrolase [Methyloceanibacter sp.]|uniref:TIGR01458 family HAD-type hydrolase n=1 Tax=Methyloceanibacter sp. TaxID=1965321 RepID=UPI003D6D3FA4